MAHYVIRYARNAVIVALFIVAAMLGILLVGPNNGLCGNYSTVPVAGCQAHYGSQPAFKPVN